MVPEDDRPGLSCAQRRVLACFDDTEANPSGWGLPECREIPDPLGYRASEILRAYELGVEQAVAGGFGGVAYLGMGYAEREACFRYHRIIDPEVQDMMAAAFDVIRAARAEGAAAGDAERRDREKGSS